MKDADPTPELSESHKQALRLTEALKRYDVLTDMQKKVFRSDKPRVDYVYSPAEVMFYSYLSSLSDADHSALGKVLVARDGFADQPPASAPVEPKAALSSVPRTALDEIQRRICFSLESIDSHLERIAKALERKIEDT